MRILATIAFFIFSCQVCANPTQIVDGNYQRYDGTGFDSMFFPCQSTEVWSIAGGEALEALVDYYRHSRTGTTAEIRTSLVLSVLPVDKTENPASNIDAIGQVLAVVSISEDENEIDSCRAES